VTRQRVPALLVERIDGVPVLESRDSSITEALTTAGFSRTPRGLRLR
jgi:ATP-dependent Lhr-like helicase